MISVCDGVDCLGASDAASAGSDVGVGDGQASSVADGCADCGRASVAGVEVLNADQVCGDLVVANNGVEVLSLSHFDDFFELCLGVHFGFLSVWLLLN